MKIHVHSKKKVFQLFILLFLIAGTAFATYLGQTQQQTQQQASANCGDTRNLIRNCDFSTAINFGNRTGPDWRDTAIDPTRNAGTGQYTREVAQVSATDHGLVGQVGLETGTCALPKRAGGGGSDLFRLYPEIGQYVDIGNASKVHVAFDFHMKSRHTRRLSAPFYVWTALTDGTGDKKGVEAFLAYVPHDTPGDVCEEQDFRSSLRCKIGVGAIESDCTPAVNGWKRVEYDVDRTTLCEGDAGCIASNKLFHIGFGVTNDYDTLVQVDNVVVTAEGVSGPPTQAPSPTPSPTINPSAQAVFYFARDNGTRLTTLTNKPNDRETINVYLDTKGNRIIEFAFNINIPTNWILEDVLAGSDNSKFPEPPAPLIYRKTNQSFFLSKENLSGVSGNLQLAKLKLRAVSNGRGQIKFDRPTEATIETGALRVDSTPINYTITTSPAGGPPGAGTTPGTGATPTPTSKRTTFTPMFPCFTQTAKGTSLTWCKFQPQP